MAKLETIETQDTSLSALTSKLDNLAKKPVRQTTADEVANKLKPDVLNLITNLSVDVFDKSIEGIKGQLEDTVQAFYLEVAEALSEDIQQAEERVKRNEKLVFLKDNVLVGELDELRHKSFTDLIKIATLGMPVMMVGPAGSGKTKAAQQVAESLGLDFHVTSFSSQTSESKLLGFVGATGEYVPTEFRKAYEDGGVFLGDEIDNGNPNIIAVLNAALSSDYCAFPDQMIKKHEQFVFMGAANTYGTGADRMYVGRNQLDMATMDRFVVLDWDYDIDLERALISWFDRADEWLNVIYALRDFVKEQGLRLIISPRATLFGAQLLDCGFDIDAVLNARVYPMATKDQRERLRKVVNWK